VNNMIQIVLLAGQ